MMSDNVRYRNLEFLGFPLFCVGTDGSVWSRYAWRAVRDGKGRLTNQVLDTWRRLGGSKTTAGYIGVTLRNGESRRGIYIHQLVLLAFVGPCPDGHEVRHFPDRNPSNNRLENLSYATPTVNQNDRVTHGTSNRGERCAAAKLTEGQVKEIRRLYAAGGISYAGLTRLYGIKGPGLSSITNRKTWAHVE